MSVATLERGSRWPGIGILILFDVELPVAIKDYREMMALSWTMASAICSVQRIPERSIRSLIRFLRSGFCTYLRLAHWRSASAWRGIGHSACERGFGK